ncbi:MAG: dinitrogenase iron-molybdenum cofactor biosynthesis protein [Clostridiales Family XIII bacterium]|jgi:predicted Fe-Mo cluster-binding NifX family protein|nr:dinitrogenase iron-molybdenum cofactor biosynthesis protein [Clostridiales Family XIII bacterium]
MKHRIALATTDKLTVYKHFGKADRFEIVDVENGKWAFAEGRDVPPACQDGGHSESRFDTVLSILSDCEAVVVARIGPGAAEYLQSKGMRVFEAPGTVEKIMNAILSRGLLDGRSTG